MTSQASTEAAIARGFSRHLATLRGIPSDARLGWKVAFNAPAIQARLGLRGSLAAGLTSRTLESGGAPHRIAGSTRIALEAEVAVRLGAPVAPGGSVADAARAIAAWAPAIEIVDFDRPFEQLEEILAHGVFHRALRLGPFSSPALGADLAGQLARVELGARRLCEVDARVATGHAPDVLLHLARLLAAHGEALAAGDLVILGAMNPVTFATAGDEFALAVGALGEVRVALEN